MSDVIEHFRDLKVYQNARKSAMKIYELTKGFPKE
ncbi:four helix bundle protein [bacterium]|nr:four helix bundle protein [candidate division CSSED10-310 bacterium]